MWQKNKPNPAHYFKEGHQRVTRSCMNAFTDSSRILVLLAKHNWDPLHLVKRATLTQPGKGRFTLGYMSRDYLDDMLTWLPSWIRVKVFKTHFLVCHCGVSSFKVRSNQETFSSNKSLSLLIGCTACMKRLIGWQCHDSNFFWWS